MVTRLCQLIELFLKCISVRKIVCDPILLEFLKVPIINLN